MDRPRDSHSEWSSSEKEGEIVYDVPYSESVSCSVVSDSLQPHEL